MTPVVGRVRGDEPITASTAIAMCIRNELPDRVLRHLTPLMEGIAAHGVGDRFHVYILSDTNDPAIAAAEEARFAALTEPNGAAGSPSPIAAGCRIPASRPAMSAISASAGATTISSR